jgi:hypothetical protein
MGVSSDVGDSSVNIVVDLLRAGYGFVALVVEGKEEDARDEW